MSLNSGSRAVGGGTQYTGRSPSPESTEPTTATRRANSVSQPGSPGS